LLAPLLALLVVGALNTRSTVVLRMLAWQSRSLPLGAWIAAAAAGGGALSAAGTALALLDSGPGLRRRIRREPLREKPWEGSTSNPWGEAWSGEVPGTAQTPPRNVQRSRKGAAEAVENRREIAEPPPWRQSAAGPDRPPGEPPPTLSVPYRVIRRSRSETPSAPMASEAPLREGRRSAEPVPASDDWGSETLEDW